jgi:hypothetical protein
MHRPVRFPKTEKGFTVQGIFYFGPLKHYSYKALLATLEFYSNAQIVKRLLRTSRGLQR